MFYVYSTNICLLCTKIYIVIIWEFKGTLIYILHLLRREFKTRGIIQLGCSNRR